MIPSPNTAMRKRPPPEKRFKNPRMPACLALASSAWTCLMEMNGTMMFAPSWYSPMTSRVKTTLLRRSGTLKMFFRLDSNACPPRGEAPPGCTRLAVGECVPPRRRPPVAEGLGEDLDASTGRLDGRARRRRHGVYLHHQGAVHLAPAEHLDQGAFAHAPRFDQRVGG